MWKYMGLLGGLFGLLVSLLVTWGYPGDVDGLNLIIYSGGDIYRYDVSSDELHYLRQQPGWEDFDNLLDISVTPSPNGLWTAITYTANPDTAYVFDTVTGELAQTIEFDLHDATNHFGTWSPDSRRIGWLVSDRVQLNNYVLTLDPITGSFRHFTLPAEYYPAAHWQDSHTIAVSGSQLRLIDTATGRTSIRSDASYTNAKGCCFYAYASREGIRIFGADEHTLVLQTNALEAKVTQDLRSIAYLQADGPERAHIFVYDRETAEINQITLTSIHVGEKCVMRSVRCSVLASWSPDKDWIIFRVGEELNIINVESGRVQMVFEELASVTWSQISPGPTRAHFPLWLVLSGMILLFGAWRMVT